MRFAVSLLTIAAFLASIYGSRDSEKGLRHTESVWGTFARQLNLFLLLPNRDVLQTLLVVTYSANLIMQSVHNVTCKLGLLEKENCSSEQ